MVSLKGDKNPNYKTGHCAGKKRPSFYHSWNNMKQRCYNPKSPKYKAYGGRGIIICDEWLNIEGFSSWAFENGWKEGLTIVLKTVVGCLFLKIPEGKEPRN